MAVTTIQSLVWVNNYQLNYVLTRGILRVNSYPIISETLMCLHQRVSKFILYTKGDVICSGFDVSKMWRVYILEETNRRQILKLQL